MNPHRRETYRAFDGELRRVALRFWPLMTSGIRVAAKKRRTLLLLFAMPAIWATVHSFLVYARYALESGSDVELPFGLNSGFSRVASRAIQDVRSQIDHFYNVSRYFALLASAWFGGGLLCDDRRNRAQLLYFARPLSRSDYLLGRFATVLFFAAMATIAPSLMICGVAAWSSPDWEFFRHDSRIVFGTLGYGIVLSTVFSLIALAASALATRKAYALVVMFGVVLMSDALARICGRLFQDDAVRKLSLFSNLRRVGLWFLDQPGRWTWPVTDSFAILGGVVFVCVAILVLRVRRWEVVA